MSSGVGDGASTELAGVGVLIFGFSVGRWIGRSAAIWTKRGLIMKMNAPSNTPPPIKRNRSTPAMIHGIFDFFCATEAGGGNGAEGIGAGVAGGTGAGGAIGTSDVIAPIS